jgi:hypothetical protein
VDYVLKERVRIRIGICLSHPLFDGVRPRRNTGKRFTGLQDLRDFLSSVWLDTKRGDFADRLMPVVSPRKNDACR